MRLKLNVLRAFVLIAGLLWGAAYVGEQYEIRLRFMWIFHPDQVLLTVGERFLLSVPACSQPLAFELVGRPGETVIQFACGAGPSRPAEVQAGRDGLGFRRQAKVSSTSKAPLTRGKPPRHRSINWNVAIIAPGSGLFDIVSVGRRRRRCSPSQAV
ncbi:MAG TPA: hypothetical protein VH475_24500 [Tepidisphaeraceae bacterium]